MTNAETDTLGPGLSLAERHNTLGLDLVRREEFGGAAGAFEESLRHAPDQAHVLLNLGYALARCGETEEAARVLGEVLALAPAEEAKVVHMLGDLVARGRMDEAITISTMVSRTAPRFTELQESLAQHLFITGNHHDLVAAREKFQGSPQLALARSLVTHGRVEEALWAYATILAYNTENDLAVLEALRAFALSIAGTDVATAARMSAGYLASSPFSKYPVWLRYQLARYCPCGDDLDGFEADLDGFEADLDGFEAEMEVPFPPPPGAHSVWATGLSRLVYDPAEKERLAGPFTAPTVEVGRLRDNMAGFQEVARELVDEGHFDRHRDNMAAFRRRFGDGARDPVFVLSTGRCGTLALHQFLQRSDRVIPYHTLHWQLLPLDRNHLLYRILTGAFDKPVLARLLGAYVENRAAEILFAIRNNRTPVIINHWDTVCAPFNAVLYPESRFVCLHRDEAKVFGSIYGKDQWRINKWQVNQLQHCRFDPTFSEGRFTCFADDGLEIEEDIGWYLYITQAFSRAFIDVMPGDRTLALESEDMFSGDADAFAGLGRIIPLDDLGYEDFTAHFARPINAKTDRIVADDDAIARRARRIPGIIRGLEQTGKFA